jgi:hypothetical protein
MCALECFKSFTVSRGVYLLLRLVHLSRSRRNARTSTDGGDCRYG